MRGIEMAVIPIATHIYRGCILETVLLADRYDGALTMGTARLSPAIAAMIERVLEKAKGND
jgi:hypothetical protein